MCLKQLSALSNKPTSAMTDTLSDTGSMADIGAAFVLGVDVQCCSQRCEGETGIEQHE